MAESSPTTRAERRHPPSLSVVIPAYNAERWIAEAIESVLAQKHSLEVIVVNDGSTDRTAARAKEFGSDVTIITRDNGGCPAAFNTGFQAATGEFVAMLPADDLWTEHKLDRQLESLCRNPDVDVAWGHTRLFGRIEADYGRPPAVGALDADSFRRAIFQHGNLVTCTTAVVRRSLYEEVGPFIENFPCEDYEFWMRALRADATFFYDPRLLGMFRQHDSNLSTRLLVTRLGAHQVRKWYATDVGDPTLIRKTLAGDLAAIASYRLEDGDVRGAASAYRGSAAHHPTPRSIARAAVITVPLAGRILSARRRRP